ncbi:MAG: beta-galactosidase trimerization domain-containing protein [Bacteroidota bacterium]|nr:beta-galactosidase trimerization domain-containing protein [Bacteroidota bacterium]
MPTTYLRFKPGSILMLIIPVVLISCNQADKPLFTHDEVMQYIPKGPADCFRQISFDVNEKKEYPQAVLNTFFSEQDPVKYAEFCQKINLDAVILQGVPQAGYATYRQTKVNTVYPGMKGDFFGETLRELHKRGISGFGYVGIGWVMKYAKEHPEYTDGDKDRPMICLNSPYRDRVMESAREIIRNYPVDGFRFDILDQPAQCRCAGCKKLYQELFNDTMPATWVDWQHRQRFRVESISRFIKDSYAACKAAKPSVPVWQNWFNGEDYADLSDANYVDMSYLEFTDPFFELFLNGIFDKKGIITGKVIEDPKRAWKCLALGGRCYSYFASVGKTGLPDADTSFDRIVPPDWFEKKLAPFYAVVREAEPILKNTRPVTNIAILYDEKTRYHYDQYNRDEYVRILRGITEPLLASGNPVRVISNINLARTSLEPYKALLLPESSGFSEDELNIVKEYVKNGGIVLITGDALSYNADGSPLTDFALSGIMGVSRKEKAEALKKVPEKQAQNKDLVDPGIVIRDDIMPAKSQSTDKEITPVVSVSGTNVSVVAGAKKQPFVHVNPYGKGFVYYIASSEMPEATAAVLNYAGVHSPVKNGDTSILSVLTKRIDKNEWFLHLLDSGQYTLVIDKKYCPATKIAGTFPAGMKNIQIRFTENAILVDVDNQNDYSTIVLQ